MIELKDQAGNTVKINHLAHCANGHDRVLWDSKPKGEEVALCPICYPKKKGGK